MTFVNTPNGAMTTGTFGMDSGCVACHTAGNTLYPAKVQESSMAARGFQESTYCCQGHSMPSQSEGGRQ